MIFSSTSITYIIIALIAALASGASVVIAVIVACKWRPDSPPEQRAAVEQWGYLVTTMIGVVLFARIAMAPLWFWTLRTLQPYVPGAMCLTGVHMAVYPTAFLASGSKFFIPMAYLYWLALHTIDQSIPSQPYYRLKFYSLIPVVLLLGGESYLDLHVLTAIHAQPVNCCTSLFDTQNSGFPQVSGPTWPWTLAFAFLSVLLLLCAVLLMRNAAGIALLAATVLLTPLALIVFAIALHTHISPVLLHTPFHHCVFCLWQNSPLALYTTAGYTLGVWLLGATTIASLAGKKYAVAAASCRRYALVSFVIILCCAGALLTALLCNLTHQYS